MYSKKRLFIVAFMALLVLPNLIYPFVKSYLDIENHENRVLMSLTDVKKSNWNDFSYNLETYYNDHLPFKNQFTFFNKLIDINLFHSIDSMEVLLGKNNWLFYKKDNCINDYRGVQQFTENELKEKADRLTRAIEWFKMKGYKVVVLIPPNKEEIYGDKLPDTVKVLNEISRVEQLVDYLQANTDITIIYPKKQLEEAKKNMQVYYKYDTHWNKLGAYIGVQELIKRLGESTTTLEMENVISLSEISGDLAGMLGLTNYFNDDFDFDIVNYKSQVQARLAFSETQQYLNYTSFESNAENNSSLMVIGDSFAANMLPVLAKDFSKATCIHFNNFKQQQLIDNDVDIIVFEMVERAAFQIDYSIQDLIEREDYK